MAEDPQTGNLPIFYGERLQNNSVVARPSADSHEGLLNSPIKPPPEARVSRDVPPTPTVAPSEDFDPSFDPPIRHPGRRYPGNDVPRIGWYPEERRSEEYYGRPRHLSQPWYPDYRGPEREPYPEYYDEPPQAYRRASRRSSVRPPPAHQNLRGTTSRGFERMEPDTPRAAKIRYEEQYEDESEGEEQRRPAPRAHAGDSRAPRRVQSADEVLRLPWTMWMNSRAKNHFVAFIGEFVGTTMFLFFAFSGTQVANIGSQNNSSNSTTGAATGFSPEVLQYIALVFAFSLMVNVWIFFRISGGLFNPAVTFAMLLTRALSMTRAFLLVSAQLAGSIFASYLVSVLFPVPLNVRTTLSATTSLAQGVFIEAVLTAELVFTIFMLAKEKHKATFIAPVGIGLALFIAELVGVFYTGGSLNPARSFGPCVVTGIFDKEHWIYWIGPSIGAILAVLFYKVIKILEYEVANPGQDDNDFDQVRKEKAPDPENATPRKNR